MFKSSYALWQVGREQKRDQMRDAARWRLLREAGLVRRVPLPRPACWLLCQLGRVLVALGRQLERYAQPRLVPQEG